MKKKQLNDCISFCNGDNNIACIYRAIEETK